MKTMQDYILEQPEILHQIAGNRHIQSVKNYLRQSRILNTSIAKIVMIASGTSYNAAVTASHHINISIEIFYPYEFNMYCDIKKYPQDTLFIFISQGGESIETYTSLAKVKPYYRTLSVTANENSSIAKLSQAHLLFGCGTENVIYRTKGFTASVMTLIILGKTLEDNSSRLSIQHKIPRKDILYDFIQQSKAYFNHHASSLLQAGAIFFVSSGKNAIIGYEAALKAIETIRLPAMSYNLEEFVHGPQNAVNNKSLILIIENHDDTANKAWALFIALKELNKHAFLISAKDRPECHSDILKRPVCDFDEIVTICALQQFCYTTSQLLGIDLTQKGFPELEAHIKKTF